MLRGAATFVADGFDEAPGPPDHFKNSNTALVSPLYHGDDCVGLSGLYAVVNAIRLAVAHKHTFTDRELHELMRAGMRFIGARLTAEQATVCGLRVSLWRSLAEAMVQVAARLTGVRLRVDRLFSQERSRDAAFAAVEQAILNWRVVMLLRAGGQYTAVSGFTPFSLLLFDSGGACWITKRLCGVPRGCANARHMLYPASFMALSA